MSPGAAAVGGARWRKPARRASGWLDHHHEYSTVRWVPPVHGRRLLAKP